MKGLLYDVMLLQQYSDVRFLCCSSKANYWGDYLKQLHKAVCCATQLVASTVVCSSECAALILFKLCGLWTECWTDCSRLERAQCIMWLIKLPKT